MDDVHRNDAPVWWVLVVMYAVGRNRMKAVLVIDVEERDIGRKVNYVSVQGGGMSYIVGTMGEDVRLRPLPQKKERESWGSNENAVYNNLHKMGWNDCLDEITGGEQNESSISY